MRGRLKMTMGEEYMGEFRPAKPKGHRYNIPQMGAKMEQNMNITHIDGMGKSEPRT